MKPFLLLCITSLLCGLSSAWASESDVTVHGEREAADEDPLNPTATNETVRVRPESPTIGHTLERATGVDIQRGGNMGRAEFIQLRGALGHQVQVVIDGMPILVTRGQSVDLSTLPTGFFQHIQVSRGGASVDYGSGALGGVIHLKSDLRKRKSAHVFGRSGSFGFYSLGVSKPFKKGRNGIMLGLQLEVGEGNFKFVDTNRRMRSRQNNEHAKGNFSASGEWHLHKLGRFKVIGDFFTDKRGEPGPMEFPNRTAESRRHRLLIGTQLRLKSMFQGRLLHTFESFLQVRRFLFADPAPVFVGDPNAFQMDDLSRSARVRTRLQVTPTVLLRSEFGAALAQVSTRKGMMNNHQRLTGNAVLHSEWRPVRSFLLAGGARIEGTEESHEMVPKLGATYMLTPHLRLMTNWSALFRLPSLDELYYEGVGVAGNPNLSAERGHSADVSLGFAEKRGPLRAWSTSAFMTNFSSLIFFAPIDAYRYRADNHPGGRIYGLETMANLRLEKVSIQGLYRYQHSLSEHRPQIPLPYRSNHLASLNISRRFFDFLSQVSVRSVSSRRADVFGNRRIPGYVEVGAALNRKIANSWLLSLSGENLLNGLSHRDFPTLPRPGRSLFIFVRYASTE